MRLVDGSSAAAQRELQGKRQLASDRRTDEIGPQWDCTYVYGCGRTGQGGAHDDDVQQTEEERFTATGALLSLW